MYMYTYLPIIFLFIGELTNWNASDRIVTHSYDIFGNAQIIFPVSGITNTYLHMTLNVAAVSNIIGSRSR